MAIRFHLGEVLLAIPFVGSFIAVLVSAWNEAGFLFTQAIVSVSIVLTISYLVLLLMVRQRREHRRKPTKFSSSVRDHEI